MVKPDARFYQASTSEMLERCRRFLKRKLPLSIPEAPMELPKYMDTGLQ